jgi:hypothetical protein
MIAAVSSAHSQPIDQVRGRDQTVDYASLTRYGPWDDRNYRLTRDDLELLAPDEHLLRDAIPAFFRVELRRRNPGMRRTGPAQYPRRALPSFFIYYGGYSIDGRFYLGAERRGGRFIVDLDHPRETATEQSALVPLATDTRVTSPSGAETSSVAIHPSDQALVIAGSNGPGAGQKMHYSTDGGIAWNESQALPLGGTCCNPSVAWSSDGSKAYAATVGVLGIGEGLGVWFYRSGDNGQSWSDLGPDPRRELGGAGFDGERLHVDTYPGSPHVDNIYLTWHEDNILKFAQSVNFGSSWTTPISISSGDQQLGAGSDITSDRSGDIFDRWWCELRRAGRSRADPRELQLPDPISGDPRSSGLCLRGSRSVERTLLRQPLRSLDGFDWTARHDRPSAEPRSHSICILAQRRRIVDDSDPPRDRRCHDRRSLASVALDRR